MGDKGVIKVTDSWHKVWVNNFSEIELNMRRLAELFMNQGGTTRRLKTHRHEDVLSV